MLDYGSNQVFSFLVDMLYYVPYVLSGIVA